MSLVKGNRLERDFYLQDTLYVAKELLGKILFRKYKGKYLVGKIVETEAYKDDDPASHAYNGKTQRNEVMFWLGGYLYVYFTYGMHYCCNVVTEAEGKGCAVLIRAIEPMEGLNTMIKLRNLKNEKKIFNLTNGPAKVCQALNITKKDNGIDLCGNEIFIVDSGKSFSANEIGKSNRIGIRDGLEKKWRFYVKNSPWVSKGK
ncbi:MAG: DNA-3-methyladenine glycosylase II [Ignavibacteriae bacterium]|nr:MAG: DNA-3-methyladenine glycosylase II [Ignavibacteriota bacterium]